MGELRKPEFITFTGADDHTRGQDLVNLAKDYPIEIGLLWSEKRKGAPRYPTGTTFDALSRGVKAFAPAVRVSKHLCGAEARALVDGGSFVTAGYADRVQVNGIPGDQISVMKVRHWAVRRRVSTILQCRDSFPVDLNVAWLFDTSGGKGLAPAEWPEPYPGSPMVGYAGGLGPGSDFDAIAEVAGQTPYWIDMESGIRNDQDEFDIRMCRAVCEQVYGGPK